jgi:serine/threonine protein phosphatase PrpC
MPKVWTAQFSIEQGQAKEKSPFIGVFDKTGPTGRAGLYALMEIANSSAAEAVAGELLKTVEREFRRSTLSVTSALTGALNTAHAQLRAQNSGKDLADRTYAGTSCAVFQGNDLYVAQAGPTLAYVYDGDVIKRHVPPNTILQEAVGIANNLRIQLHRHPAEAGTLVLLAAPSLAQLVTTDELVVILTSEPDTAIQRLYLVARKSEGFSALLLALL